ncbi:MAG: mannose-1-phosphate guanylyltransferase / mannose-6-phosphate isomerase [Candidatus Kentron sp. G]|nr:MAG: mannose-1-phosphate guanylyltransferase / mannose-6-phosphate isomerase [Candidatus Kentron sp. G]VFM96314.1 MAG: mannose-1-phosphate guanylyltransferase / mannose-6-phosphate isomerase [Candidatus Kentron sp. G]VFM98484.1 MAG: mannose-1-phosphate guanylyltransferase / mannose-6-phosphate isomerase [Candidatus Kentron sp. G]
MREFIEKPDAARAESLLLGGDVFWNAGIFLVGANTLLDALERYAPDILEDCRQAMAGMRTEAMGGDDRLFARPEAAALETCRSQSIDYALMEKTPELVVVPFDGQWSDVGSWRAVADLTPPDGQGNRVEGQGTAHLAENTYIHAPHRPVVALGTRDLLIADTPDAVLVADSQHCEQVKDVLARLEREQCPQAVTHRRVARPWGWYDRVDGGDRFQVKHIGIKPGASLSLQRHYHRAEHWIVVKGTAEITRDGKTFLLSENESTFTPVGALHRVHNPGKLELELEMIEIQSGSYLGEDDIVRLEDSYGRNVKFEV